MERSDHEGTPPTSCETATWPVHFRTNRSCRLAPAHEGLKIGTAHTPLDSGAVSGFEGAFAGNTYGLAQAT